MYQKSKELWHIKKDRDENEYLRCEVLKIFQSELQKPCYLFSKSLNRQTLDISQNQPK